MLQSVGKEIMFFLGNTTMLQSASKEIMIYSTNYKKAKVWKIMIYNNVTESKEIIIYSGNKK